MVDSATSSSSCKYAGRTTLGQTSFFIFIFIGTLLAQSLYPDILRALLQLISPFLRLFTPLLIHFLNDFVCPIEHPASRCPTRCAFRRFREPLNSTRRTKIVTASRHDRVSEM